MTNESMIRFLVQTTVLHTPAILEAFRSVDRKDFVAEEHKEDPYGDYPLPIGHGQTISQPWTVAFMLELLQPEAGDNILDVGSGSAWSTALLAHITGNKGRVYGTEIVPELVEFGKNNLARYNFRHASIQQVETLGLPEHAPYDRILVSAAADELPKQLLEQLKIGGKMVVPIRSSVWLIEKTPKGIDEKEYPGFAFVPLRKT